MRPDGVAKYKIIVATNFSVETNQRYAWAYSHLAVLVCTQFCVDFNKVCWLDVIEDSIRSQYAAYKIGSGAGLQNSYRNFMP